MHLQLHVHEKLKLFKKSLYNPSKHVERVPLWKSVKINNLVDQLSRYRMNKLDGYSTAIPLTGTKS